MNRRAVTLLVLAFVIAVSFGAIFLSGPPRALPVTVPPDQFSAARALLHLNEFAQKPHPLGSAEHDRVRDYLLAQLKAMGLSPEIQRTTAVTPLYQVAGSVENIVARFQGTSGAHDAALFVAHYDSVQAGPGAGDDGSGTVTLLETIRALRTGATLRNDLIFLFTDGEEDGLLGASAFVAEHPWAKDVRVVFNFEGRGNSGPSQMFETGANNGRLIEILAHDTPHPAANSLTYEIYKHMPNDTDMSIFKKAGMPGLNFAFIGHWEAYHTPLDNPQQLNLGSLQQDGYYALGLARNLGNADLAQLSAPDAVYFSVPPGLFFHYLARWIWPLFAFAVILFVGAYFHASGAFETRVLSIVFGFFANLFIVILLPLGAFGFVRFVNWLHRQVLPEGNVHLSTPYVLSLVALLLAVAVFFFRLFHKWIPSAAFFLGGAFLILVLEGLSAHWLAGGSFLLLWPLLAALFASIQFAFRGEQFSLASVIGICLLALPALLFSVPLFEGFFQALGFTTLGAPVLAFAFALFLILLFPLLDLLFTASRGFVPVAALIVGLVCLVYGGYATHYSAEHPKPSMLAYALDVDTKTAQWASTASRADSWTAQYVGTSPVHSSLATFFPNRWLSFLEHEAPSLPLDGPQAQLLDSSETSGVRTLHLHIASPRHARSLAIHAPESEVIQARVNDHVAGSPSESRRNKNGKWSLEYVAIPPEGIDLKLQVQGTGPVRLDLIDRSMGLPAIPGQTFVPRPPDSMPHHWGDQTIVHRSFVF